MDIREFVDLEELEAIQRAGAKDAMNVMQALWILPIPSPYMRRER